MNAQEAQARIQKAMTENAESVIAAALKYNPTVKSSIDAARAAPGPILGVAAIAVRYALTAANADATRANMIAFAMTL